MDSDSGQRLQISAELGRLRQAEFFRKGARWGHTPDEICEYKKSRERVRELFQLLEQLKKRASH